MSVPRLTLVENHVKKTSGPIFLETFTPHSLKVVTNEKGEAVGEVLTIIC
jgi:hypothetical protein